MSYSNKKNILFLFIGLICFNLYSQEDSNYKFQIDQLKVFPLGDISGNRYLTSKINGVIPTKNLKWEYPIIKGVRLEVQNMDNEYVRLLIGTGYYMKFKPNDEKFPVFFYNAEYTNASDAIIVINNALYYLDNLEDKMDLSKGFSVRAVIPVNNDIDDIPTKNIEALEQLILEYYNNGLQIQKDKELEKVDKFTIESKEVLSMQISPEKDKVFLGSTLKFEVTSEIKDNDPITVTSEEVDFINEYTISSNHQYKEDFTIYITNDVSVLDNPFVYVKVCSAFDNSIFDSINVPISFSGNQSIVFRGENGYPGQNGHSGHNSGSTRDLDGQKGYTGGDGSDCPSIEIFLDVIEVSGYGKMILCMAKEEGSSDATYRLATVEDSSFEIWAIGGNGGVGGQGGTPSNLSSLGYGYGGDGGDGGDAGNGGEITVYQTEAFINLDYKNITFHNDGGTPGLGGWGGSSSQANKSGNRGYDGNAGLSGSNPVYKNISTVDFGWKPKW